MDHAAIGKLTATASHTFSLEAVTTAQIVGQVTDKATGKPMAGVRVSAGGQASESTTDGSYALTRVAIGPVMLLAQHRDYRGGRHSLKLKAGESYGQDFKLNRRREDVKELQSALRQEGTVDLCGIHFDSGKDQFKPSSLSTLQAVSEVIKSAPGQQFEIAGHTDSDGPEAYNQNLSERRDKTIINWLVHDGVEPEQLVAKGFGEARPVAPDSSASGKALNRRVQLKELK